MIQLGTSCVSQSFPKSIGGLKRILVCLVSKHTHRFSQLTYHKNVTVCQCQWFILGACTCYLLLKWCIPALALLLTHAAPALSSGVRSELNSYHAF